MGTLWDLLGQFLENQLPGSNRHWQQLDLAFPCSLLGVANLCPCPKLCRMAWMPVARPLGRPLPMPLAQVATLAKEPGLESGTFGCSLGTSCHLVPQMHNTLCSTSAWGGGMI